MRDSSSRWVVLRLCTRPTKTANKLEPIEGGYGRRSQRLRRQSHRSFGNRRRHHGGHGHRRNPHATLRSAFLPAAPWVLKTRVLNVSHGEAVLFHHFREYGPYSREMAGRKNGGMIAMSTGKAVAYARHAAGSADAFRKPWRRMLRRHDRGRERQGGRHGRLTSRRRSLSAISVPRALISHSTHSSRYVHA